MVGNSGISALKHSNLASLIRMRLSQLKDNKYYAKKIILVDCFAGNGCPTENSSTTSSIVLYEAIKAANTDRAELWLNDIEAKYAIMLRNKYKDKVRITCAPDKMVYVEIARRLASKENVYFILFIDPNKPSDLGRDELLELLKMSEAKELDLIFNFPATSLKRNTTNGDRLRNYVDDIMASQNRKAWIRKPVKGDKWQWVMIAFFEPKSAPKGKALKGWCDVNSSEGEEVIEYFSTTNKEKEEIKEKEDKQLYLFDEKKSKHHTAPIMNTYNILNSEQLGTQ